MNLTAKVLIAIGVVSLSLTAIILMSELLGFGLVILTITMLIMVDLLFASA